MTKRETFLFSLLTIFFIAAIGALVYFVVQYLNIKVENSKILQNIRQVKNTLELTKEEVKSRDRKIEELKDQISKFKNKVISLKKEITGLEKEKQELIEDMDALKEKFSDVDAALEEKSNQIWRLKKELMRTRGRLFAVEEYLQGLMKAKSSPVVTGRQGSPSASTGSTSSEEQVSLGKIVVASGQGTSDAAGAAVSARVLSINTKYGFAIFAMDKSVQPHVGWHVRVELSDGKSFVGVIDTVRRNMVTMDIPKNIDIAIGDRVQIVVLN